MIITTACTEDYVPGVLALNNSLVNWPEAELHCFCFDEPSFIAVEKAGIHAKRPHWNVRLPKSSTWSEPPMASFFRLKVPQLYRDCERVIWLDADAIVQQPLTLGGFSEPVAAVYRADGNFRLGFQVRGLRPDLAHIRCTCNGLLVFNVPEWNRLEITEQCESVMNTSDLDFRYVDQSVLSYVLRGNWHRLDHKWLCFANRKNASPDAPILVWAGGVPWRDPVGNTDAWNRYGQ